jgi:hypothetical protein
MARVVEVLIKAVKIFGSLACKANGEQVSEKEREREQGKRS